MNIFDAKEFGRLLLMMGHSEGCMGSDRAALPTVVPLTLGYFKDVQKLATSLGFDDMRDAAGIAHANVEVMEEPINQGALASEVRHVYNAMMKEAFYRRFLHVKKDRIEFLEEDNLFGVDVTAKFSSANRDLKEAGNCLAAECGTAAVFHLMRAAEFALRALARDRAVEFSDKPLEDKQWGEILPNLEKKVRLLSEAPANSWANFSLKGEQVRFYSEVVQELRGFNDAWRKHVSHADTSAFCERDTALGILKHVRTFMQKLAAKISEHSVTEMYWK